MFRLWKKKIVFISCIHIYYRNVNLFSLCFYTENNFLDGFMIFCSLMFILLTFSNLLVANFQLVIKKFDSNSTLNSFTRISSKPWSKWYVNDMTEVLSIVVLSLLHILLFYLVDILHYSSNKVQGEIVLCILLTFIVQRSSSSLVLKGWDWWPLSNSYCLTIIPHTCWWGFTISIFSVTNDYCSSWKM